MNQNVRHCILLVIFLLGVLLYLYKIIALDTTLDSIVNRCFDWVALLIFLVGVISSVVGLIKEKLHE